MDLREGGDHCRGQGVTMKVYRKIAYQPMDEWVEGYDMTGVSVGDFDRNAGSPKVGDMIATSASDPTDKWLIAEAFFKENYEEV
jgi:hypothetical protein